MSLNRKQIPSFKTIETIEYIKAEKHQFKNGIPVYCIKAGDQELVKIDIVFDVGDWHQKMPMLSYSTLSMLSESSLFHTAEQIAEKLDFYGAYVYYNAQKHTSVITVYSLLKYLDEIMHLIEEIIKSPLFPEKEFETFNNKRKQQFVIESQKVEIIAQRSFNKAVFGKNHPYGNSPTIEDFDKINTSNIKSFHSQYYSSQNCTIIIAGNFDDSHIEIVNRNFGGTSWGIPLLNKNIEHVIEPEKELLVHIPKKGTVQSAVRIGLLSINKMHEDFPKLQIVNTVLGGYFGSRLMSKIREEKGYTYSIGSGLMSFKKAGYFVIVSEIGKNVVHDAVKEIYSEIKRLQEELIDESELSLVRNYMMASILRNFDGPFTFSDTFKTILEYNIGYEYYDNLIKELLSITPQQIRDVAVTYLDKQKMYEIISG